MIPALAVGGNALTWIAAVIVIIATMALPIIAVWMEIDRAGEPDEDESAV